MNCKLALARHSMAPFPLPLPHGHVANWITVMLESIKSRYTDVHAHRTIVAIILEY